MIYNYLISYYFRNISYLFYGFNFRSIIIFYDAVLLLPLTINITTTIINTVIIIILIITVSIIFGILLSYFCHFLQYLTVLIFSICSRYQEIMYYIYVFGDINEMKKKKLNLIEGIRFIYLLLPYNYSLVLICQ